MKTTSTATVFHILPGMTPAVLDFFKEITGPRLDDHEAHLKRLGLTVEQAWIEPTNEGDMLVFYFESPDIEKSLKGLGESNELHDVWFREKMYTLTGADLCDYRELEPSELLLESPQQKHRGPVGAVATVFPVLPGKLDELRSWLADLTGPRQDDYKGYLWRYGLTRERFFLKHAEKKDMIILHAEGDEPASAISRFARSSHPFDAWMREELLYLCGIDFIRRQTAPAPHLVFDWRELAEAKAA